MYRPRGDHRIGCIGDFAACGCRGPSKLRRAFLADAQAQGKVAGQPHKLIEKCDLVVLLCEIRLLPLCYASLTWAEDRATVGTDLSADPGAKTGGGRSDPPPLALYAEHV
jgi:hypothetical protein